MGDLGLIPGLGSSPGGGNGYPFQHSCLENSTDRSLVGYIQSMGSPSIRHDGETNTTLRASQVALVVKNLPASAGDVRDTGLFPGLGRSPGGGGGNPLQCSCLENSMDRGAWWAIVHRVA